MLKSLTEKEIGELLMEYNSLYLRGDDYGHIIAVLEKETQFPNLEDHLYWELIENQISPESEAEYLARYQPNKPVLNRDEMVDFVKRILAGEGSDAEISEMVAVFDANCKHPAKNSLIFWPNGFSDDANEEEPTPEEIVEKAMKGEK